MKKLLTFSAVVLFFSLISCDPDEGFQGPEITLNIVETASGSNDLTSLVAALLKADENVDSNLVGALSSPGVFTVFAPSNQAFANLLASLDGFNSLADFDTEEERALLAKILQYHVVSGVAAQSGSLSDGGKIATIQGEEITVNVSGGVRVTDKTGVAANVIAADILTTNGVVHIVDKVLLPQEVLDALTAEPEPTITDLVVATESLSVLKDAVIKADLAATLASEGPFTVFAPSNDAFVALLDALGDDYNSLDDFDTEAEIALLTNILLYHVIPANVLSTDLAAGAVGTALTDNSIEVIDDNGTFVIGDASDANANITAVDIMASNGTVHTIDKVLLPQEAIDFVASLQPSTITDLVVATESLSVLKDAVIKADLAATLASEGPFTVFAPSNDAFVALLDALGDDYNSLDDFDTEAEIALLTNILLYHVIPANVLSTDLAAGAVGTALTDNSIEVIDDNGTFVIGDASDANANITAVDIMASNGTVHTIDKVLLPQEAIDFVASL